MSWCEGNKRIQESAPDSTHTNIVYIEKGAYLFVSCWQLEEGNGRVRIRETGTSCIAAESWMEHFEGSFHVWR